VHIITHIRIAFTLMRHRLARWIAPDLVWNTDMSRENDRLRRRIEELEGRGHD